MKKMLAVLSVFGVAAAAYANGTWGKESGNWHDEAKWSTSKPESPTEPANFPYYEANTQTVVNVCMNGEDIPCCYITASEKSGVTANDGTFECPYVIWADGGTLDGCTSISVSYRRQLTIDGLVVTNLTGYSRTRGRLILRNCDISYDTKPNAGSAYLYPDAAGGEFVLDNSRYWSYAFSMTSPSTVKLRNGSFMAWERSWNAFDTWALLNFKNTDSTVWAAPTYALFNLTMFPRRPGGVLIGRNGGVDPCLAYGQAEWKWRLGGEAWITNNINTSGYATYLSVTNDLTVYGRGQMAFNNLNSAAEKTATFGLSRLLVGYRMHYTDRQEGRRTRYLGDCEIIPHGSASASLYICGTNEVCAGTLTIDSNERDGRADYSRTVSVNKLDLARRAGLAFKGLGTVKPQLTAGTDRLAKLEIGEGTTVAFSHDYYYERIRTQDLKLGANARISMGTSSYNGYEAIGDVEIDPTATFVRGTGAKKAGAEPYLLLSTLDFDVPQPKFELSTLSEGYEVKRSGGTFYYGDGQYGGSPEAARQWTGKASGSWSDPANWGANTVAEKERTATFTGCRNVVVTNDTDYGAFFRLVADSSAGPFIVRGNPIALTAEDGIKNSSPYPLVLDVDVSSALPGLKVYSNANNMDATVVHFRRGLSVPNGTLSLDGDIVVDGAVSVKDLAFLTWSGRTYTDGGANYHAGGERDTSFTVRRGGVVNIAAQSTVQNVAGRFVVREGGAVNLAGDLVWNDVANDHTVHGSLAVTGALGGNVAQTYGGRGVLSVGTLAADGAGVKLADGLTLRTTAAHATAMPLEVTFGDATLAPAADLTLAGDVAVNSLAGTFTVSNDDCAVTFGGALTGYDFDLVKTGSGVLTLGAAPGLQRGYTTVSNGTLALTRSVKTDRLTLCPGTTIRFGADADAPTGVATVATDEDLDLTGVTLEVADDAVAAMKANHWTSLLTVPAECMIAGLEAAEAKDLKLKVVRGSDQSCSVQGRVQSGTLLLVR